MLSNAGTVDAGVNDWVVWYNSMSSDSKKRLFDNAKTVFYPIDEHLKLSKITIFDESFTSHYIFKMMLEVLRHATVKVEKINLFPVQDIVTALSPLDNIEEKKVEINNSLSYDCPEYDCPTFHGPMWDDEN